VSAAALALVAGSVTISPASAFVGLSDKQADEISDFIRCKTYLLKGDLKSFNADPDCGGGPVVIEYLGAGGGNGGVPDDECEMEWPDEGHYYPRTEGYEICYEDTQ